MHMIKVTDYIAQRLRDKYGIKCFFLVSGGGAMHLNDSLGQAIPYVANHHEQACAIAAEGYSRAGGKLAVVNVTTGPGGLNALNGVFGQWTDSVPVLYISGQVKQTTMLASCPEIEGLRQLGDQEVDILSVVRTLTKYAASVNDPKMVKYHLDKAIHMATSGRPGPVWLDVPMNIQGALVDESELVDYVPESEAMPDGSALLSRVVELMQQAQRPLIVAGNGLHISRQEARLAQLLETWDIPVVTTFNAIDILPTADAHFVGRIGTVGQRAGNFALQNADVILFLGSRNNIRQVSYNWENFAAKACKIVVDIDPAELQKPLVKPDVAVNADLADFMPLLIKAASPLQKDGWMSFCQDLRKRYDYEESGDYPSPGQGIGVYAFFRNFCELLPEKITMVAANGSACVCLHQVGIVKAGQRIFYNSGNASMGYELPAAIGAAMATPGKDVVCLAGDGSIMMNLQELQTIRHYKLPIKIFVVNNAGYSSIRQTQRNFFSGRMTGCGAESGVSVPDFCKVAAAFDLPTVRISEPEHMGEQIQAVLSSPGPILCEVMVEQEYAFIPKLSSRKLPDGTMVSPSLEDMFPFVDREEYKRNMLQ